jgi:hypothetical protein
VARKPYLSTRVNPLDGQGGGWHRETMTKLRSRTLALIGTLVVAAVAVRGSLGALLGIGALLVLLDAVVPMPGVTWSEADDRFTKLLRARRRARRWRRLRGLEPGRLEVMDDRGGLASRRALGVRPIAIDSITATVEELKARAFDDEFRPGARRTPPRVGGAREWADRDRRRHRRAGAPVRQFSQPSRSQQ